MLRFVQPAKWAPTRRRPMPHLAEWVPSKLAKPSRDPGRQREGRKRHRLALALTALIALIAADVGTPMRAFAGTGGSNVCAHGGNAASTACVNNYYGDIYYGGLAFIPDNNMYLDQSHYNLGFHINQEMWLYTQGNESQWVELGLRNGYAEGGDPCGDNSCLAYERFWADFDSSGNEWAHYIANATPDGATHDYAVERDYGNHNNWDVEVDGNRYGISTDQHNGTAYEMQIGLEISRGDPSDIGDWSEADQFDDAGLSTREADSGIWDTWTYQNEWIDAPCGGSNPPGACLSGSSPDTSDWIDSKGNIP